MKSGWVLRPGAAEFPHENALINRGSLWIGTALCGAEVVDTPSRKAAPPEVESSRTKPKKQVPDGVLAPAASRPATSAAISPDADAVHDAAPATPAVRDAAPATPAVRDAAPATPAVRDAAPPMPAVRDAAPATQIDHFVRAIAEVALAHGAPDAAAHVESLFKFGTPAALELSDLARAALFDGNILEATAEGLHATDWFTRTSSAWQKMLRGEAENLAVCGESTLDGWTADLIARLVAKPAMASAIRRDLRRRGIAAFGMLDS